MATTTISGSVGGITITVPTSTPLQASLAQEILASTTAAGLVTGIGGPLTTTYTTDTSTTGSVLTGLPGVTAAQVLLDGQFGTYITGSTNPPTASTSIVVAADYSNSSIVNNNPLGGLVAQTGAGGNVLEGLAGQNNFFTGIGGQDLVYLDGASNTLTTNGADNVFVGGPSTVTAAATGLDSISLTSGTNLAFINGSKVALPDTITGFANSSVVVAGTGATSIVSGTGPEASTIDTGAGNVTLNGSLQSSDLLTLNKDAATTPGTANVIVNNFSPSAAVNVHGYAGAEFSIAASAAGGSTLALTDGSSVTFTNLTVAQLTAITKVS